MQNPALLRVLRNTVKLQICNNPQPRFARQPPERGHERGHEDKKQPPGRVRGAAVRLGCLEVFYREL